MIILFDGLNVLCNVASYQPEETAEATLREAQSVLELACPDINEAPEKYTVSFVWDPTHHGVREQSNPRKLMFPEYKGNRRQKNAKIVEAVSQKDFVKKHLKAAGIHSIEQGGLEADDLISFICRLSNPKPAVIVSEDKDFLQLVDHRVSVIRQNAWIADHNFHLHLGMPATSYLDWKIVTGDPSDNIPHIMSKEQGLRWVKQGAELHELDTHEQAAYHRNKNLMELKLWTKKGVVHPQTWRTIKKNWRQIAKHE